MENWATITFGLIITYFLFRFMTERQKNSTDVYSDILTNDKYRAKGQWDR